MHNQSPSTLLLVLMVSGINAAPAMADSDEFSMKIMDTFAITGRGTVMTGRVDSGSIANGDTVCVPMDSGETLSRKVEGIEQFRKILDRVEAGQMAGILVSGVDTKHVEKGAILNTDCKPAEEATNEG